MSLDSIVERIWAQAKAQEEKILQQAKEEAAQLIRQAQEDGEKLLRQALEKEQLTCEKKKQAAIVNARLKSRNYLLAAKQELLDRVFVDLGKHLPKSQFKTQLVYVDKVKEVSQDAGYYLENLRNTYEPEIAALLFKDSQP
jgi:V/A-type H+-transporting ATPase subunit E